MILYSVCVVASNPTPLHPAPRTHPPPSHYHNMAEMVLKGHKTTNWQRQKNPENLDTRKYCCNHPKN